MREGTQACMQQAKQVFCGFVVQADSQSDIPLDAEIAQKNIKIKKSSITPSSGRLFDALLIPFALPSLCPFPLPLPPHPI